MPRSIAPVLLVVAALPMGGCVAGIAAGAVGVAGRSLAEEPRSNAALRPEAVAACKARAAQYGTARIIDSEQHEVDRIFVWGAIEGTGRPQSFECAYGTKVVAFRRRPIPAHVLGQPDPAR